MLRRRFAVLVVAFLSVSCAGSPTAPGDMDIIAALQQQGIVASHVERMPRTSFPFFSVNAERLSVNGEAVHVFQYASNASAQREAQMISSDGTAIGATQIGWISTPSFYRRSSTIVLYVGRTNEIATALTNVLGQPIAGGGFW